MRGTDTESSNPLDDYWSKTNEYAYTYYDDEDTFFEKFNEEIDGYYEVKKEVIEEYRTLDEEKQVEYMLCAIDKCKTFDEQWALTRQWANCKESADERGWIIAVAWKLMDAEQYQPLIVETWRVWRALCQTYFGPSRDSEIPGDFYNVMRKKCYTTCLKHIENHPDDTIAMNNAALFAGYLNIRRYGEFSYGNDGIVELFSMLPGLYGEDD